VPADWFVKTRGRSASEDYTWFPVGGGDPAGAEAIAERGCRGRPWYTLIDEQKPGMLLFDDPRHGTVLFVSALVIPERPQDFRYRVIRVTLLGAARPGDAAGQRELVAVAVAALRDEVAASLPVRYGPAHGVKIDAAAWGRFAEAAAARLGEPAAPQSPGAQPPGTQPPGGVRAKQDSPAVRLALADSLAGVYRQFGADALDGRLMIMWTPIISVGEVRSLLPWRMIADEFAGAPAGTDLITAVRDVAHDIRGVVREGENQTRRILKTFGFLGALAAVAVGAYFVFGAPGPSGWQIAGTVPAAAGSAANAAAVPLGPGEALSAWLAPGTGRLVVRHWSNGAWTSPALPHGLPASRYGRVTVAAGPAADAWVFASPAGAADGTAYALHWDGTRLEGPVGRLPAGLLVTAAQGSYAAGATRVTVTSARQVKVQVPVSTPPPGSGAGSKGKPTGSGPGKPKTRTVTRTVTTKTIATRNVMLRWTGSQWQAATLPALPGAGGTATSISSVAVTSGGQIWVTTAAREGGKATLLRLDAAVWQPVASPVHGGSYSIAPDGAGGLWLGSNAGGSLYRYLNGAWTPGQVPTRNGHSARVVTLAWLPERKAVVGFAALASDRVILSLGG
jgi:hypothetical protein